MSEELMTDDERIEAIFRAAVDYRDAPKEHLESVERRLSDAIDEFGAHCHQEGYAQRKREEAMSTRTSEAMTEIWGLPPRRAA